MVSAWRNFKNIFPRPLFIIIFRPEMLKFRPYSILTGDTRVEFVIYCLLKHFRHLSHHYNNRKTLICYLCIQFSPDKISSKCSILHHIRMKLLLIYYIVSAWKEWFLLSNRDFFAAVPLLNPLDDPKCERTKMSVPRTPGR